MSDAKAKRRKPKPHVIKENGVHVRLFKRGKWYWLDVRHGTKRTREPAKTTDKATAEANAKDLALEIAKQDLLGVTPDTLRLDQLFSAYAEHKGKTLAKPRKATADRLQRLYLAAWGGSMLVNAISQSSVDSYCAGRRAAFLPRRLRDGALDNDFRWLRSVMHWAIRHKTANGKRLLTFNPLDDCAFPKEQNVRRPIATHERFVRTMAQAPKVDPSGRFALVLTLARYTARRIDAILHLRANDVLLTAERIRGALAATGQNEGLAADMPFGAIFWRAEHDKQGVDRITPISQPVRAEIDRYFGRNPKIGDVPLIPAEERDGRPVQALSRSSATKWLRVAEQRAELPKLKGGLFHAYRRLWATERKALPDVDVAEAGGWTGTKAMKLAYQGSEPAKVLAAVLHVG